MSESKPVNPQAFESDNHINIDYHDKDGNVIAHHNYAVDERGKKHHISADDTLITRGYDPEAYKNETEPPVYGEVEEEDTGSTEADPTPDPELYDQDLELEDSKEQRAEDAMYALNAVITEGREAHKRGDSLAHASAIRKASRYVDMISDLDEMTDTDRDIFMAECLKRMIEEEPATEPGEPVPEIVPATPDEVDKSRELMEMTGELTEARDNLARLNLKVAGKIITGPKIRKELEAAQQKWQKIQVKIGTETLKYMKELDGELTPDQLKTIAMQGAIAEAKLLAEQEALLASQGGGGNILSRAWKRYAASYEKAGFIGKAVRLAPAGLLAGIAVGTVFGAVGGGIFGALIAKGATKGALTAKVRASGSITEASTDVAELNKDIPLTGEYNATTIEEIAAMRAADVNTRASRERVEGHLRKNRKRMAGSVALGAVLGGTFGAITNQFLDQSPLGGRGLYEHKIEKPSITEVQPTGSVTPPAEVLPVPTGINPIEYAGSHGVDLGAANAWPFKIADQLGLSQSDSIELARANGFSYESGQYWIAGRVMNPTEMKFHNIGLAEIAAKRFQG